MSPRLPLALVLACTISASAASLPTAVRPIVPAEVQQIISLDQRAMRNADAAQAIQARFLPSYLKQFDTGLKSIGIDPDKDLDQIVFVTYRSGDELRLFAAAQGSFTAKQVLARMAAQKTRPAKHRTADIYSMNGNGGLQFSFLDQSTILIGDRDSVRRALDARDNEKPSLASQRESRLHGMIASASAAPLWSVLDAKGAQHVLRGALGQAAEVADYETVKDRLLGARYAMDFGPAMVFEMSLSMPDNTSAATLSTLVKAGLVFRRVNARAAEKQAFDSMQVEADNADVAVRFRSDEARFRSLLDSELLAAVSR